MSTTQEMALGYTTTLAAALNYVMATSAVARAAYRLTYGVEWSPLGNAAEINDGASTTAGTVCWSLRPTRLRYKSRSPQFSMIPISPADSARVHRCGCGNDLTSKSRPSGSRATPA